jgi:hypothetical protein
LATALNGYIKINRRARWDSDITEHYPQRKGDIEQRKMASTAPRLIRGFQHHDGDLLEDLDTFAAGNPQPKKIFFRFEFDFRDLAG